ncbi:hypothetical protein EON80_12890, partial [bacterium]
MSVFTSLPASFPPQDSAERALLLDWIRGSSLVYGPWKGFKKLYKDVETAYANGQRDPEILAALIARLDLAPLEKTVAKDSNFPPVLPGSFSGLQGEDNLLFTIRDNAALIVYDLSAPLEPREIFKWSPAAGPGYYARLLKEGNRLIFTSGDTIHLFDLEDPRKPRYVGLYKAGNFNAIAFAGDHVFLSDYSSLRVIQLPAPGQSNFTQVGRRDFQYGYNIVAKADLIAISHYSGRGYAISLVDVSNPTAPAVVGQINAQNPSAWQFVGDTLVRLDREQLVFTDLSKPDKPREIGKLRIQGAQNLYLNDGKAFVSCASWRPGLGYENKLRIVNIEQHHSPHLVGEFDGNAPHMAAYGDLLYLAGAGLKILDVADISRPQPVGKKPKHLTFAYLKRRARRLLRTLAQADSDAFVELSSAILQEAGRGHDAIDVDDQWVSAELTLGGGRWR